MFSYAVQTQQTAMTFRYMILTLWMAACISAIVVPTTPQGYYTGTAGGFKLTGTASYATPVIHHGALAYSAPTKVAVDSQPRYSFAYDVQDTLSGDSKSHHETRSGDVVQGFYSVADPDGTKRTVEYTADPHNGFNAVVHREPLAVKVAPVIAKVAAPVSYSAPASGPYVATASKYTDPLSYTTAPVAYSSPYGFSGPTYYP